MNRRILHCIVFFSIAFPFTAAAAAAGFSLPGLTQPELLEPDQAFQISTRPLDESHIEVRFRIADGYYMYRDRFRFETMSGKLIADVELPPGILKKDAFFGETQTYRREVVIRVPVSPDDVRRGAVKLKVTSQGCADVGVCYVPQAQTVQVRFTANRDAR